MAQLGLFLLFAAALAAGPARAADRDAASVEAGGTDAAGGGGQKKVDQLLRLGVAAGAEQGIDAPSSMVIPTGKGDIRIELQPKGAAAPPPPPASGRDYTPIGVAVVAALFVASLILRRRTAAPAAPALNLPDGAFAIVRPLGQGGMGVVYEAIDRKLDRRVAIKRLRPTGGAGAPGREQLIQEAKMVAALRHPNIVDVHSIIEQGGEDYIVFELVEGRTLDELLREHRRLGARETRGILSAVCAALEFAHARGVVHRDLKPANIMITAQGVVKVMDFGIARKLGVAPAAAAPPPSAPAPAPGTDPRRVETTQHVMGTPQYLAPEAYCGQVRPESDVYALGVILYRMLSGQLPFAPSSGLQERLARGYTRLALFMPELPPAADALVNDALEPDPEKRLSSPKLFAERLAAL
jgi:serine/threonine protein kinase